MLFQNQTPRQRGNTSERVISVAKKQKQDRQDRLDVYELREDLLSVAENEAKKKPDISKQELKKKLSEYVTGSRLAEAALSPGTRRIVERIIGIVAELTIKTVEIYLREKKVSDKSAAKKDKAEAKKQPAAKKEPAPKKKAVARKKSAAKKK
jgi:hypothetical protein